MESKLLNSLGKIAGLGGVVVGVFFLLFRDVIAKDILPKAGLESGQSYALIMAILILTFGVAGVGIVAWLISKTAHDPVPTGHLLLLSVLVVTVLGFAAYSARIDHASSAPVPTPAPKIDKEAAWHRDSDWMDGGHNPETECDRLAATYQQATPGHVVTMQSRSENNQKDWLGHVTYQYHCSGTEKWSSATP